MRLEVLESRQLLSTTLVDGDLAPVNAAPADVAPDASLPPTDAGTSGVIEAPDAYSVTSPPPVISLANFTSSGVSHGQPAPEAAHPIDRHPTGPQHLVFQITTNLPIWVLQNMTAPGDTDAKTSAPGNRPGREPSALTAFDPNGRSAEVDLLGADNSGHGQAALQIAIPSEAEEAHAVPAHEAMDSLAGAWTFPIATENDAAAAGETGDVQARIAARSTEDATLLTGPNQTAPTPVTRSADLLPAMVAFDTAALDRAIVELTAQVRDASQNLGRFFDERGLAPWVFAAALGVVAGEIGRRKMQPRRPARYHPQGTLTSDPSTWISGLAGSLGTEVL